MPDNAPEILTDAEAARLWQRAAELQTEAAATGASRSELAPTPVPGYALTHVRAAALEAGIGAEFVDAALADVRLERSVPATATENSLARRLVRDLPDSLTIRRAVDASPQDVLSAMEAVFSNEPHRLTLTDRQGDSLDRGVLTFEIAGSSNPFDRGLAMAAREVGIKQLHVTLRPLPGPGNACEVTMHSQLTAHKASLAVAMVFSGLAGVLGLGAFLAIGMGTGIGPLLAVPGALIGGGLGLKAYRALCRFSVRRATEALGRLLGAVAARAKGGWGNVPGGGAARVPPPRGAATGL